MDLAYCNASIYICIFPWVFTICSFVRLSSELNKISIFTNIGGLALTMSCYYSSVITADNAFPYSVLNFNNKVNDFKNANMVFHYYPSSFLLRYV